MATLTFGAASGIVNANKTFAGADADVTGLLQWASIAYQALILAGPPNGNFTGSIAGSVLTVTAVASGSLATNQFIFGPGIPDGCFISSLGTGGGGPGTYNLSFLGAAPTVASEAMKSYGPDVVFNTGLAQGTLNAWLQAQQKFVKDHNVAAVPTPPPLGWS